MQLALYLIVSVTFVILGGLALLLLKVDFDFSDIEWEWSELDMDYLGDISIG